MAMAMATATIEREVAEKEQYLTFLLAGEEYAITLLEAKEIIAYDTVTAVPKTPKWIRGVINLRGSVVPVADLGVKFGIGERPVTKTSCIIIVEGQVESQNTLMGVMADELSEVMDIAPGEIRQVPVFGTRIKVDYLQGMAQLGKKFVLLLDTNKVLSADEALDLSEAATNAREAGGDVASPNLSEAAPTHEEANAVEEADGGLVKDGDAKIED